MRSIVLSVSRFVTDWRGIARLALGAAFLIGFGVVFLYREAIDPAAIEAWASRHAAWETVLAFFALHVVASLFFIPRLFLGLAAGALFGTWLGSLLAVSAATFGGLIGFWLVRIVSADAVKLAEAPAIGRWLEKAEAHGWRFVLVARLVPVLPHSLVNYVFGLSRVSSLGYAVGSALGMIPTAVIYVNMGATGRALAAGTADLSTYALLAVWGLGLLFVSWFLPRLMRRVFPDL